MNRLGISVIGWALAASAAWADGKFYNLGGGVTVYGVTNNAAAASGYTTSQYFYWTPSGGIVLVGGTPPGAGVGGAAKIADDGTRFSGTYLNPLSALNEMSYYDVATAKWNPLGGIGGSSGSETSSGWAISGNGKSVVGLGWVNAGSAHAIQWKEGGSTIDLGSTVPNRSTRANGVNADGSVVVGWQDDITGFRQGAVWVNGVQTVLWVAGGTTLQVGEAQDVSDDGTWVVGNGVSPNGNEAYRWSAATGGLGLGHLNPAWRGAGTAISADGKVIIGYDRPFPGPALGGQGFIWTEQSGMVNLNTYVQSKGVDTGGVVLALPLAISPDGNTFAGIGVSGVSAVGFVVTIKPACVADIDGDGKTCQADLGILLASYGLCEGDPGYIAAANLSTSTNCPISPALQVIDQTDLGVLLADFGCGGCP